MLAPLDWQLFAVFAFGALHAQHNLFGSLGLLTKDWLRLTAVARLLAIVASTSCQRISDYCNESINDTLRKLGLFAFLVLRHLVICMLATLTAAKCFSSLRYIDHDC